MQEERSAAAEAAAAAMSGAMEHILARSLEQHSAAVADSLAEHRSMMALTVEAMRKAAGGAAEEFNPQVDSAFTPGTGTEASPKADFGWPTVTGLFWLKEGDNTVGSDASNDIRRPAKREAG